MSRAIKVPPPKAFQLSLETLTFSMLPWNPISTLENNGDDKIIIKRDTLRNTAIA
jgi:hypothetical protein